MTRLQKLVALPVVLVASACASTPKPSPDALTPVSWGAMLAAADSMANAGRHSAADSVLLAFERAHPGTRAAEEVRFWRALYKLDPRSSAATRAEGRALMDSYAASPKTSWYRAQANVLRVLARDVAEPETPTSTGDSAIVAGDISAGAIAARDRLIRTQRAEIARLTAELERIKRRLAAPSP